MHRLQDPRHAGADLDLAHALDLTGGDGLLGDVGGRDPQDLDGKRSGRRSGDLRPAAEETGDAGENQNALDSRGFTYNHVCKSI